MIEMQLRWNFRALGQARTFEGHSRIYNAALEGDLEECKTEYASLLERSRMDREQPKAVQDVRLMRRNVTPWEYYDLVEALGFELIGEWG